MLYTIHRYPKDKSYHHTFFEVISFIQQQNEKLQFLSFHWSRFEWMIARDNMDLETLEDIIIFRDQASRIVGMLIVEDRPGEWFMIYHQDKQLKVMMVHYIVDILKGDIICPIDEDITNICISLGYQQDDWKDPISIFDHSYLNLSIPENYHITSLEEDYRLDQIHHVLWLGFNHGDDIVYDENNLEDRRHMTSSPHFNKRYTFVAQHDTTYVSYAGIWYIKGDKTALIEPVATIPNHRRKGLAEACIMHAIHEAVKDGASNIFVGSDMKFYQDIGFKQFDYMVKFHKKI